MNFKDIVNGAILEALGPARNIQEALTRVKPTLNDSDVFQAILDNDPWQKLAETCTEVRP